MIKYIYENQKANEYMSIQSKTFNTSHDILQQTEIQISIYECALVMCKTMKQYSTNEHVGSQITESRDVLNFIVFVYELSVNKTFCIVAAAVVV